MKRRMLLLLLAFFAFSWGIDRGLAQSPEPNKEMKYRGGKLTTAERKAASKRAQALGLYPGIAGMDMDQDQEKDPVRKTRRPSKDVKR